MKKAIFIILLSSLFLVPAQGQRRTAQSSNQLVAASDSISFALGFLAGKKLVDDYPELKDEINFSVYRNSFEQALDGRTGWLDEDKLEAYVGERHQAKRRLLHQANIEAGERFLAANRQDPEIHETASGLQYKVLRTGRDENERPRPYDDMHITYTGKTLNGEVFTSGEDEYSYPESEIDGLTEGTQLMSPGAKYIFYIPAGLAYGEEGNGALKPYSVAIYEVEMVSMTRDHDYYDEDEGEEVDMNEWDSYEESSQTDDSEAHVRQAGDYTATTLPNLRLSVPVNGYDAGEIVKTYRTEGFTIAVTKDKTVVFDPDNREIFRNTLDEEDNNYDSYYLTEYRSENGTGPVFLVLDIGYDGGSHYGSMLYVIEEGQFRQTDKYLALVNDEGRDERLTPILTLHRNGDQVEFRFASDDLRYDPIGETLTVSGEDFWYVYRDGQLAEAGPVTALSRFRNR